MRAIRGFGRKQKQAIRKVKELTFCDIPFNENGLFTIKLDEIIDSNYIQSIKHSFKEEILQSFIDKALQISLQPGFQDQYQIAIDIKTKIVGESIIIIGKEHIGFNAMLSIDNNISRQIESAREQIKWTLEIPEYWKNKQQRIDNNEHWYIGVWA